jgi:hypothetical protein
MGSRRGGSKPRPKRQQSRISASQTTRVEDALVDEQSKQEDTAPPDVDDAWSKLRQGARNVAGVSWQIEVTTHMLVLGRCGLSDWTDFTPEGIEDVDCRDVVGLTTYVQMKEVRAGQGRMTAKNIADALTHAHKHAEGRPIVVVTDGDLGSDLSFTGWDIDMRTQASQGVSAVAQHLVTVGISENEVHELLGRTFLVRLPWDLRPITERLLVDNLGIPPAVSGIAVSRLNGLMTMASANQRSTTAQTAHSLSVRDVDVILAEVQSTVDFEGLDKAVSAGVCAPANYIVETVMTTRQFFLGTEGAPGIISAGHDVVRPKQMHEILDGFQSHNYSLLLGPSGAGKSVLLWRAARDIFVGASVLRVVRVSTADDVEMLTRHVTLQKPSQIAPLIVAADNLGRPQMGAWPDAARRLREIPWVYLLGAVRSEDFSPRLISGGAALVELSLDLETAADIASAVQESEIELRMAPEEAQDRAQGLLMEYLALLVAGQRFRDVLADQIEGLRNPERRIERTLARWVTAAHSIGLGIEADVLSQLIQEHDDVVGDALNRLRGEHMVLRSGTEWRGLHELRSVTIAELLHESPPPTLAQTYSQVAQAVALPLAGWFLRRLAHESPQTAIAAADSIGRRVASTDDPNTLASALEGAERADSLIYADQSLQILRRHIRHGVTVHDLAVLVYPIANHGVTYQFGIAEMDAGMTRVATIASEVGPRSAAVAQAIGRMVSGADIVRLTAEATDEATARLLEACDGVVEISTAEAQEIYSRLSMPKNADEASIHARIISSLSALAGLDHNQIAMFFGTLERRANMLTSTEVWALNVVTNESEEGTVVSVKVLCPNSEESFSVSMAWEASQSPSNDRAHDHAMRVARRIADGCPEADVIEVQTLGPTGSPYVVGDHEPGYKRLKRRVFPRPDVTRRSVSYQAALRRLDASSTWSDLVREQVRIAGELVNLLEQGHLRLMPSDNAARRRDWKSSVSDVVIAVTALKSRPVAVAVDPEASHAQTDQDERNHDPLTRVYEAVSRVLQDLPDQRSPAGIAFCIEAAIAAVDKAESDGFPTLGSLGSPLPGELRSTLLRLLDLQRAVAAWPAAVQRIKAGPESVDQVIARVVEDTQAREKALLGTTLSDSIDYRFIRARSDKPRPNTVDGRDLILIVELSSLEDLLVQLADARDQLREGLSAWVYIVCTHEGNVLPMALQLTAYTSANFLPVPIERQVSLFEAAGLSATTGVLAEEVAGVLREVGERSYLAALHSMRDKSWPTLDPTGTSELRASSVLDDLSRHQSIDPLMKLCEHVLAEEEGLLPPGQLAGALLQSTSGQPLDADQESLLRAFMMANLLSLG